MCWLLYTFVSKQALISKSGILRVKRMLSPTPTLTLVHSAIATRLLIDRNIKIPKYINSNTKYL